MITQGDMQEKTSSTPDDSIVPEQQRKTCEAVLTGEVISTTSSKWFLGGNESKHAPQPPPHTPQNIIDKKLWRNEKSNYSFFVRN